MSKNKKIIIILLFIAIMFIIGIIILIPVTKYILQYINKPISSLDESDKSELSETLYGTIDEELFPALQKEFISKGYTEDSVNEFIQVLKSKFDKNKFKKETWNCVSKYSAIQMYYSSDKIWNDCFDKWFSYFYDENDDVFILLKKK